MMPRKQVSVKIMMIKFSIIIQKKSRAIRNNNKRSKIHRTTLLLLIL